MAEFFLIPVAVTFLLIQGLKSDRLRQLTQLIGEPDIL